MSSVYFTKRNAHGCLFCRKKRPRVFIWRNKRPWVFIATKKRPWVFIFALGVKSTPKPQIGLSRYLDKAGWVVVAVDKVAKIPCDVLDSQTQSDIKSDISDGVYDCVGVATPCETFSPLRENPPGPRPLRSLDKPMALEKEELTEAEYQQLKEGNRLVFFSAEVVTECMTACKGFWWENPDHGEKLDLWKTNLAKKVTDKSTVFTVGLDQCRLGAETRKPTKFATFLVDLLELDNTRCDHEKKEHRDSQGKPYFAAHESLVQRWRQTSSGRERASKALGEYPAKLNERLASGMAKVGTVRTKKLGLAAEPIPWHPFHTPVFEDKVSTERDRQNDLAIGGMRNPKQSSVKIPKSLNWGKTVYSILKKFSNHPPVTCLVDNLISGKPAEQAGDELIGKVRHELLEAMGGWTFELPEKTTKAESPLFPPLFWKWGQVTEDPDAETLARWILEGAPLGYSAPIPSNGIFPVVEAVEWEAEAAQNLIRDLAGWSNRPSADEEAEDMWKLIEEAQDKGFCTIYDSMEQAKADLGTTPILSKLGVIVKFKEGVKKARIIWDLRESKANELCNQGERILLPRVLDAVNDALEILRKGGSPAFLAVDVRDAFHNIPSGSDKSFTTAAFRNRAGDNKILCYDVLVFGAVSSPSIWGRYASFLGRSLGAIAPALGLQIYVDDPIITFDQNEPLHRQHFGVALLWFAALGFPIKLSKADSGTKVKWIGATLETDTEEGSVKVSVPSEKIKELANMFPIYFKTSDRPQTTSISGWIPFICSWHSASDETVPCWALGSVGFDEWQRETRWKVDPHQAHSQSIGMDHCGIAKLRYENCEGSPSKSRSCHYHWCLNSWHGRCVVAQGRARRVLFVSDSVGVH